MEPETGCRGTDEGKLPCEHGENGSMMQQEVWLTTQLDSSIGDLQSVTVQSKSVQETALVSAECENASEGKRRATKKKRRQKPRIIPTIRIFIGTFVHATQEEPMVILEKWMIGVDGGKILFSESMDFYDSVIGQYNLKEFQKECIVRINPGEFMMPGFVDCHTHVIPFLMAGLREKYELLDGLVESAHADQRTKTLSLGANDKYAASLFASFITMSLMNGITCAAYNGSVIESTARLLTDIVGRFRQRAVIGLEMFHGDNRDDTHIFQIIKARDVAEHIIRKKSDRMQPCLILSKPLPDWLEKKVCDMAEELNLSTKLMTGDRTNKEVKEMVKDWVDFGRSSPLRYHKKHCLINSKSVLVDCSLCSTNDFKLITGIGCGVVYSPSASMIHRKYDLLNELLRRQITVGLGTDMNSSHNVSMLETIRTAVQCLKLARYSSRPAPASGTVVPSENSIKDKTNELMEGNLASESNDEVDSDDNEELIDCKANVSFKDLFRMATLGGATVLGLDDKIGNFEVGKEFDAVWIQPNTARSRFLVVKNHDTLADIVEKFFFLGDDRNIYQVYVAGERLL